MKTHLQYEINRIKIIKIWSDWLSTNSNKY